MVKITKIEIKNFKAFYGTYQIDLHKAGKNLLIYGENGSGKTSLYKALELFLDSSENDTIDFKDHQNRFNADKGYIKLHLRTNPTSNEHVYEWSDDVKETVDLPIITASKSKGFFDYKALLETHYLQRESDTVNVFNLLIENLLANITSDVTGLSIAEEWENISEQSSSQPDVEILEEQLAVFNRELADRLRELEARASEILNRFDYNVSFNLTNETLDNQEILLRVKFFDKDIPAHHRFLNEAKLSAMALSIYFAGFLLQPESDLKILALDDVLIGLDMSNRIPVLDILNEYFSDYQIFLTTYDKAWYEIVKQRTNEKDWKYTEFYFKATDEYEIPVCKEESPYLKKAKDHLDVNDYKACVIYLRTAFEEMIKRFCKKKGLQVRYCENPKKLDTEDFWRPIKTGNTKEGDSLLDDKIVNTIEQYRTCVLNPLSHATIVNVSRREIEDAIEAIEDLKEALAKVESVQR